jgi:hypothetical protein
MRKDAAMPQPVLLALTITIQIPVVPTSAALVGLVALLTTYFLTRRDRQTSATISSSELDYRVKVEHGADLSKTYNTIAREIRVSTPTPRRSPVLKWVRIVTLLVAALVAAASYLLGYVLKINPFQIVCNISAGVLAIFLVINLFAWLASLIDFSLSINLKPSSAEAFSRDRESSELGNRLLDVTLSILAGVSSAVITLMVFNSVLS